MATRDHLANLVESGRNLTPKERSEIVNILRGEKSSKTESGNVLHNLMRQRGLSQGDVANIVGVSQPYVSSLTSGRKRLSADNAARFTTAMGLNDTETLMLNTAAAKDAGFKIDLTTTKLPKGK